MINHAIYVVKPSNFTLTLLKTLTEIGEWLKNHEQRLAYYNLVKGFLLRKD